MKKQKFWKSLGSKTIFKNQYLRLDIDKVNKPEGIGDYSVIRVPNGARIVALTEKNEVLLIKEFKYPNGKYILANPAGGLDKDDPLTAAKREFLEETGYKAKKWQKLGTQRFFTGLTNGKDHIFLARGLTYTGKGKDMDKEGIIKILKFSPSKIMSMIKSGEIDEANTIAAIMLAYIKLGLIKN